ncbi:MAG: hypothetical protein LBE13_09065 [Bacteroidales bacterium]|jgi:acyl carrier protein|nr:hypothetical protein [Bacteroidales bacterium]
MLNSKELLWEIFNNLALIEKAENGDFIIHNDDMTSIQMISIIVDIEDKFRIEIPDVYMVPEFMSSFDHVLAVIQEIIESENNELEDASCIPSKII